jgi:hypothetical protein
MPSSEISRIGTKVRSVRKLLALVTIRLPRPAIAVKTSATITPINASDGQPQTGANIRQRRRQDQVAPPPALSGAAGLRHLDQVAAGSTATGACALPAREPTRLGVSSGSTSEMSFRYAEFELIGELA